MSELPSNLEQFQRTWQTPGGLPGWFAAVNNQPLGKRFMITSFIFFLLGGVLALLMRIQLTVSDNTFLGPLVYNQLFTMHGSTMMYLFAVPFMEGLALYLLPLMLGSRDVAFPRLTAFSYWTFLFGGLIFYSSFLVGMAPDAGWFAYTPLSKEPFSGKSMDFWLLGLAMVEIGGIGAGIEVVVTILKFRAPGMAIHRMPLFAWAMLVTGVMIIFAFTTLLMATVLLELDRAFEFRFFDVHFGGSSLLWQHLFWFFGHPEVYIAFLPATGIVSMIAPVFARRAIVGYTLIAVAIVVTGFLSFGLWVHHMYTTGLPELSMHFFAAASLMIALASGTQIFAWIATLWGSRPELKVPLMYVLGFIFLFVLGGFTGVMVAVVPFDWQVHDTFFLVAHFHYVLIGGVVFPIFGGLHYWLPKITGRMLSERLGHWGFWLFFIGFNLTFFPMHIMGFFGMPRRVYTYPAVLGIDWYNIVATVGAFMLAIGVLVSIVNFARSLRRGVPAAGNPWNGDTLEWSVESPPPMYSFHRPPIVHGLHPLWTAKSPEHGSQSAQLATEALAGAPEGWRGTLTSDILTAEPQSIQWLPGPTYKPFLASLGLLVAMIGVLIEAHLLLPLGIIFSVIVLIAWLRPSERVLEMLRGSDLPKKAGLPIFNTSIDSSAGWGMICLLAVLATAFGVAFYSYFYIRLFSEQWPQDDLAKPGLALPAVGLALLLASAITNWLSGRLFFGGQGRGLVHAVMGLTAILAAGFLVIQVIEWTRLDFVPQTNAYGSVFYLITAMAMVVVLAGLFFNGAGHARLYRDPWDRDGYLAVQMRVTSLYWYFAVAAAAVSFSVVYVSPHVI